MSLKMLSGVILTLLYYSTFAQSSSTDSDSIPVSTPKSFVIIDLGDAAMKGAIPFILQFGLSERSSFQVGVGPTVGGGLMDFTLFGEENYHRNVYFSSRFKYYFAPWTEGRHYSIYSALGYQVGKWESTSKGNFFGPWHYESEAVRHFFPAMLGAELRLSRFFLDFSVGPNFYHENLKEVDVLDGETMRASGWKTGFQLSWQLGFMLN